MRLSSTEAKMRLWATGDWRSGNLGVPGPGVSAWPTSYLGESSSSPLMLIARTGSGKIGVVCMNG
jgi:hypothetical protein